MTPNDLSALVAEVFNKCPDILESRYRQFSRGKAALLELGLENLSDPAKQDLINTISSAIVSALSDDLYQELSSFSERFLDFCDPNSNQIKTLLDVLYEPQVESVLPKFITPTMVVGLIFTNWVQVITEEDYFV